jgi:uncharacterized protein YbjT (DUF2867 family)
MLTQVDDGGSETSSMSLEAAMTILVTGARGAVARGVIQQLVAAGANVRAASSAGTASDLPERLRVARVDLAQPETVRPALEGVRKVFLYAKPTGAEGFVTAAHAAGVEHVVFLSSVLVTLPGAESNPVAQMHAVVERALRESGIAWTFVRPGAFATNALGWAESIRATQTVRTAFPDAHSAPIHERDLAAVAVSALLHPGHKNAAYSVSGPESLSQRQQSEMIAQVIGSPLRIEQISLKEAREDYLKRGFPAPAADAMIDYFGRAGDSPTDVFDGVPRATGRPATPFAEWAKDHAHDFRSS